MMTILVTYVNIRIKNYLKLLYNNLNSPQGEAVPYHVLANAIFKNNDFDVKKIIKKVYSNFFAVTDTLPSLTSTCQSIVSPASMFKIFTISFGKPTRRELVFGFA